MSTSKLRILVVGAHPDDAEVHCGGMLVKWAEAGHAVGMLSVTDGGAGHHRQSGALLVRRRQEEAKAAAALIGASSHTLGAVDGGLEPVLEYRIRLIRFIREFQADVVITNRLQDYHPDHRYTAQLVQDAAFCLRVPNIAPAVPALKRDPVILHFWDAFRKPVPFDPAVVVAIDDVYECKLRMIHQHTSQFYEWLPALEGCAADVPGDEELRFEWLHGYMERRGPNVAAECRQELIARYGAGRGADVKHAEAFEVSEYGGEPDDMTWKVLFGQV